MYNHKLFLVYWLGNCLLIYLFSLLFPGLVVTGNYRLIPFEGAIFSSFWLTFFVWTMWEYMFVRNVKFDPKSLEYLYSIFLNLLGIWIVSRYSEYSGLGIANLSWVLILGILASLMQRFVLGKIKKGKY